MTKNCMMQHILASRSPSKIIANTTEAEFVKAAKDFTQAHIDSDKLETEFEHAFANDPRDDGCINDSHVAYNTTKASA